VHTISEKYHCKAELDCITININTHPPLFTSTNRSDCDIKTATIITNNVDIIYIYLLFNPPEEKKLFIILTF